MTGKLVAALQAPAPTPSLAPATPSQLLSRREQEVLEQIALGASNKEIARALDIVGEWWTPLILRDVFRGMRRFEEIQTSLGIARNILSNRLARLVEHGIMKREPLPDDRRKIEYRLTEKGLDLLPAMLALRQWGEKYGCGVPSNPVLCDAQDGLPIAPIGIYAHDGRPLGPKEMEWRQSADVGKTVAARQDDEKVRPVLNVLR